MKISYRWVKEYVETDFSAQVMADRLTNAGIEVAEVVPLVTGLSGVVVGEVEAIEKELSVTPAGHRLSVCRVATRDRHYTVVCGAPNVAAGVRAAFAPPGAALPGGQKVRAARIRGQPSEGMLCSEKELGIGDDAGGILLLASDAPLGGDLVTYLGLDDWILEVEVTPNRPDCLSVVGVAREVAALTGAPFRFPVIQVKEGEREIAALAAVEVEDPELCPRYAARLITGLSVAPSPPWLAQRLRAVGLRPVNNLVDVTNCVLWELGHPLHAFDFDTLAQRKIVVRRARSGEHLMTLDGQDRALTDSMLLIADAERGVGLAGVMGGANTEVTEQTTSVLLESAYFNPGSIRRTSRSLGLATDAAYRFERGADIEGLREALDRAAQLMADLGGGTVVKGVLDVYPSPRPHPRIPLRLERIRRVIGVCPPQETVVRILQGLGFAVDEAKDPPEIVVPSFRRDVSMEDDLAEEVIRVWGYDRIPSTLPGGSLRLVRQPATLRLIARVRQALTALGLAEVITYSFVDPQRLRLLGWDPASPDLMVLRNPLSQERSILRPALVPGLLEVVATNRHRQLPDVRCFEVGRTFRAGGPGGLAREELMAGIALTGLRSHRAWYAERDSVDLYDAKGAAEHVLAALGVEGYEVRVGASAFVEEGRSGEFRVAGEAVGWFGELALGAREGYDLSGPVYLAELSLDRLGALPPRQIRYRTLPRFPAVQRDIALVMPQELTVEEVEREIRARGGALLKSVMLFDVYTGKGVEAGMRSVAWSLIFQADDRTLTDAEVNALHAAIVEAVGTRFRVGVRGA
ncbi:MAG: phenylalanine--tRNA ligase subunit beta [Candidatus Rokubacteria bacterium]|nr:phenylalanine--tRNA ligase subunit beta [Candidatus Rokubacteria bacterium]